MKCRRFFFAGILLFVATVGVSHAQFPQLFGTTPNASVRNWMKFVVVGSSNSLFPVVTVSPQAFKISGYPESLVVLPYSRYSVLADFTENEIRLPNCKENKNKFASWYTVMILRHARGVTKNCLLYRDAACDYFFQILHIREVAWQPEERKPIFDFMRAIKCKSS